MGAAVLALLYRYLLRPDANLARTPGDPSLLHESDAELAAQMANVLARPAPKGWVIEAAVDSRTHQSRRIVGAQAAMLAVHRAMTAPRPPSRAMHFGAPPWG